MQFLRTIWLRLRGWSKRGQLEQELQDEVAFHLSMREAKNRRIGLADDEARYAARKQFGNATLVKEEIREMRIFSGWETTWRDIRIGTRALRKNPGFTAVVVLSLGLGIGANSTIFSVMNTVLYRPLPYPDPEKLVVIWDAEKAHPESVWPPPIAEMADWKKANHVFEEIAMMSEMSDSSLSGLGRPVPIRLKYVTPTFFDLLKVHPILGREFLQEDLHEFSQAIVISNTFWKGQFGGDRNVLGKTFEIQGISSTIVGVMPEGFAPFGGDKIDLWWPINPLSRRYEDRIDHWLLPVARLKPGVTLEQAQSEMDVIAQQLKVAYPKANKGVDKKVEPLHHVLYGRVRNSVYPLMGAVICVLLIACVNVSNLFQSRTETRRKEYALRTALGAGRARLVRQLLTESVLLAAAGGIAGIFLTFLGIEFFRRLAENFPNARDIAIDTRVLLFTLGVSLLTSLVFGLAPAVAAASSDLNLTLRDGERGTSHGKGRVRRLLAIAEVALAMVLLVGAGLMINSVLKLEAVNPGFDFKNVMTMMVPLPEGGKYLVNIPGQDAGTATPLVTTFFRQLLEKVSAIPGVESVGLVSSLPPSGIYGAAFTILGQPAPAEDGKFFTGTGEVSADFFRTLKIPLKEGRYFNEHDSEGVIRGAVINEAFARKYLANEEPIGKQLVLTLGGYPRAEDQPREIIGVVGDVRHSGRGEEATPFVYTSYQQPPGVYVGGSVQEHLIQSLVLRTSSDLANHEADIIAGVKKAVADIDPDQPVTNIMTMEAALDESVKYWKFYMKLFGIFAGMAILLAAVGIYGVMSYFVNQRTKEIGIRVALGAQRGDVLGLVTGLGLKLTAIGVVAGAGLALVLTRLIARFLFGVTASDPLTYVLVAVLLTGVSLLACYLPARNATRVDPLQALRSD